MRLEPRPSRRRGCVRRAGRERAEPTARVRFGDEQWDRVRPLVHDGEPAGPLVVDRLDLLGDPRAHGIIASREMVRVVRMQALHAGPRPADTALRFGAGMDTGAFAGVLLV